ncbi:MAG: sigma-54 dependent transcriptional regulator, partial [Alphaproteobacteria bacterium]|nr:sigma-54 dependent transcriptional regulator [Alphaproteobacteria bacterium]
MREILIVDDEHEVRRELHGLLEDAGFAVREACDEPEALAAVARRRPALLLLDIWLGSDTQGGLRILENLQGRDLRIPVVIISGHGTIETAVSSIKLGASDFIEKPFGGDQLLHVIRRTLEASDLRRENRELRLRAGKETELIGDSELIEELRAGVQKVAPTGSRVLFTGPPGVGKEVAARQLHQLSNRAEAPFLAVNCAVLHPERSEAELFGTEGGAAGPPAAGVFEQAHGGTLLLDEVGDMPLETQGKLLRLLQEQRFHRLGGATPLEVDVRVIASSVHDLGVLVAQNRFREELFYRLNTVHLRVPALSRRREDIPALCDHFLRRAADILGLAPRRLGSETLSQMQNYDWPGNVRQLRNVIDGLLIMSPGGADAELGGEALPPEIRGATTMRGESGVGANFPVSYTHL